MSAHTMTMVEAPVGLAHTEHARPLVSVGPGLARVGAQVAVLVSLLASAASFSSATGLLVASQVVVGLAVYAAYRTTGSSVEASVRTISVWGVGAVLSLSAALVVGTGGLELLHAQVWAVLGTLVVAGVGRGLAAYRAAGDQLDALLATLPATSTEGLRSDLARDLADR